MKTCKIQWVCEESGWHTSPDNEPAVAIVFREAYVETSYRLEGTSKLPYQYNVEFTQTEEFPICAWHAEQLKKPGMEHWKVKEVLT